MDLRQVLVDPTLVFLGPIGRAVDTLRGSTARFCQSTPLKRQLTQS
jgi:hypothetical protein